MQANENESRGSVLVVDDEVAITEVLTTILNKQGFTVTTASDGVSAIEKASQLKPDLIIMDIIMPSLDGYETTAQIRTNPRLDGIPVIFLSGRPPLENQGRAFQSGGALFLKKPFTNTQFMTVVNLALGKQSLSQETRP
jgi:CheY-like chemotaxis protein